MHEDPYALGDVRWATPFSGIEAPPGGWPAWQLPARYFARFHPGIRAFLLTDLRLLSWLRIPRLVLFVAVMALVIIPSLLHAFLPPVSVSIIDPLRPGWQDVFTESLAFMALAAVVGLLAPSLGVLFVLSFAIADLAATWQAGQLGPLGLAIAGRLVSYWLLWLLAVEIPIVVRWSAHNVGLRASGALFRRLTTLAVAAVSAGILVWVWTQAVILLIRPVFTWRFFGGSPSYIAIGPVQERGILVALVAVVAALVVGALSMRSRADEELSPVTPSNGRGNRAREMLAQLVVAALLVAALGGVITGALDVAILFLALIASRPVGTWLRRHTPLSHWLGRIPWAGRFLIAFVVTYALGILILIPLFDSPIGTEFLGFVLTIALGVIVFEFFLAEETGDGRRAAVAVDGRAVVAIFALVAASWMAFPVGASADNCVSPTDCFRGALPAAAGAAAAAGGAALAKKSGQPKDPPPKIPSTVVSVRKGKNPWKTPLLPDQPSPKPLSEFEKTQDIAKNSQPDAVNFGQKIKDAWKRATDALQGK